MIENQQDGLLKAPKQADPFGTLSPEVDSANLSLTPNIWASPVFLAFPNPIYYKGFLSLP